VSITGLDPSLELALDLVGVFVFALSGAAVGRSKNFDVVGIAVLAMVTGLGGGLLRDVLLDEHPPAAFREHAYLWTPLLAVVAVLAARGLLERLGRPVLLFDAAGLGLFCVVGTAKALEAGLAVAPAVLLGSITAVGGGVLRDVLAREVPSIFRADSALYAIPATLGAIVTAAAWRLDQFRPETALAIAGGVLLLRILALRYNWRAFTPQPPPDARG
jgi:uncharacterized membrane protein YeiH